MAWRSVAVTVSAAEGVRGMLLQGRRKSTNLVVGQFVVDDPAVTAVDCDGPDDTLVAWYGTHSGSDHGDAGFGSRSFKWMPPDDGADTQLEFVCVTPPSCFLHSVHSICT